MYIKRSITPEYGKCKVIILKHINSCNKRRNDTTNMTKYMANTSHSNEMNMTNQSNKKQYSPSIIENNLIDDMNETSVKNRKTKTIWTQPYSTGKISKGTQNQNIPELYSKDQDIIDIFQIGEYYSRLLIKEDTENSIGIYRRDSKANKRGFEIFPLNINKESGQNGEMNLNKHVNVNVSNESSPSSGRLLKYHKSFYLKDRDDPYLSFVIKSDKDRDKDKDKDKDKDQIPLNSIMKLKEHNFYKNFSGKKKPNHINNNESINSDINDEQIDKIEGLAPKYISEKNSTPSPRLSPKPRVKVNQESVRASSLKSNLLPSNNGIIMNSSISSPGPKNMKKTSIKPFRTFGIPVLDISESAIITKASYMKTDLSPCNAADAKEFYLIHRLKTRPIKIQTSPRVTHSNISEALPNIPFANRGRNSRLGMTLYQHQQQQRNDQKKQRIRGISMSNNNDKSSELGKYNNNKRRVSDADTTQKNKDDTLPKLFEFYAPRSHQSKFKLSELIGIHPRNYNNINKLIMEDAFIENGNNNSNIETVNQLHPDNSEINIVDLDMDMQQNGKKSLRSTQEKLHFKTNTKRLYVGQFD